ncbi:NrsF family protein [Azorhizobium sp. AG788]|uniref:NrsF family protein n=1 Tax=Azorhizobium sp. AG788 TaxID=2183897 RepID=UPI003138EB4E
MRTQDLISALAADTTPRGPPLRKSVLWAGLGAIVLAAMVMQGVLGTRGSFIASLADPRFLFKFLITGVLASVAFRLALRSAEPQSWASAAPGLLLGPLLLLATGVVLELSFLPRALWMPRLVGQNWQQCLIYVPLISLAPLALVLTALRGGASASPTCTGLVAGIASGALGAFFYAAHCPDDSPLFVAVWYMLGIGIMACVGALLGRRLLRW